MRLLYMLKRHLSQKYKYLYLLIPRQLLHYLVHKLLDTSMAAKDTRGSNKVDIAMYHVYLYKFFLAGP